LLVSVNEDIVEQPELTGRLVVALHQHFAGAQPSRRLDAERLCQRVLQFEYQAVLAPFRQQMQPSPQELCLAIGSAQRITLGTVEETL
jgi:hypothetical protein